jgi:hypothetical protein
VTQRDEENKLYELCLMELGYAKNNHPNWDSAEFNDESPSPRFLRVAIVSSFGHQVYQSHMQAESKQFS